MIGELSVRKYLIVVINCPESLLQITGMPCGWCGWLNVAVSRDGGSSVPRSRSTPSECDRSALSNFAIECGRFPFRYSRNTDMLLHLSNIEGFNIECPSIPDGLKWTVKNVKCWQFTTCTIFQIWFSLLDLFSWFITGSQLDCLVAPTPFSSRAWNHFAFKKCYQWRDEIQGQLF